MKRRSVTLIGEPTGQLYTRIVGYAATVCDSAILVVQNTVALQATGKEVLELLEPNLKERNMRCEWPGTKLLDGAALVLQYWLTEACVEILKASSTGLYGWCQPELPEDLAFLRSDGAPWLVSTAHEREAYFCLEEDELLALLEAIPQLRALLKMQEQ
jgi:hypothetical protein